MEAMSVLRAESDTLLLSDPSRSRTTVHVGVAHPTPLEEAAFGKMYLIVEIENTDRINHDVIQALQEELRNVYYQSSEFAPDTAFETALQRGNERLHRFISEGVTQWFERFNAIVAVVRNDLLTFSQVGRMHAFMFRGSRITDIAGKNGSDPGRRNPLKIFSTIMSGHLQANDRILLCTSSILDYFSQEKLKRLVIEDLPSATVAKIEQGLLANNASASFAALFFAFLPSGEVPAADQPAVAPAVARHLTPPERSMDELISKERATEELLSPSILPNIGRMLGTAFGGAASFIRTRMLKQPPRRRVPRMARVLPDAQRPLTPPHASLKVVRRVGLAVLLGLLSIPRYLAAAFGYRKKIVRNVKDLPERTSQRTNRIVAWIRSMTASQRIIGVAALVVLFILAQTVVTLSTRNASQRDIRSPAEITASIQDDLKKASAALTYDDFTGATKLLKDASSLLEQLPKKSRKEKEVVASLQKEIDQVRALTRRVTTPTIATVADLTKSLNGASPRSVSLTGTSAIIATGNPPAIYQISRKDGAVTTLASDGVPDTAFSVPVDSQTILFGTLKDSPYGLPVNTKKLTEIPMSFPNADRTIVAGSIFQSRLYLLDTGNASILRAPRAAASFGAATLWLKERYPELKDGTGITVDGSIYVTTGKGALLRFTNGLKEEVDFDAIDPPLSSPVGIWTNDKSPNLYILEPSQQRILQLAKATRTMKAQYVSREFGEARAFAVDEKTKTLFVLTTSALLSFPINP